MPETDDRTLKSFEAALQAALSRDACWGVVVSQPIPGRAKKASDSRKLSFRPVELFGQRRFQLTERKGAQEFHHNLEPRELCDRLRTELGERFAQADLFTDEADFSARQSPDGGWRVAKRRPSRTAPQFEHDRPKQHLIPEGRRCPFLTEIGVMNSSGQVKAPKQAKFRQINRFLEFVDDVMPHLPPRGPLRVVDFGCGKSYLTFALHHLLTELRGREVEIVGLDLKAEVVQDCQRIAETLGCRGLRFEVGDIASYSPSGAVDLSVSLHACDTATDAAIAQAIGWRAAVILAVPCCQHEVCGLLPDSVLPGLLHHGILKERIASLATDALRAALLEAVGYRTQVVEFIDLEHTPKNLLIRAVRNSGKGLLNANNAAWEQYQSLKYQLGLTTFALERHLNDRRDDGAVSDATSGE